MRIANLADRLVLLTADEALDVERASKGRFAADPSAIYSRWDEFLAWARGVSTDCAAPFDHAELGPPSPAPAQVFGVGLNYRDHAEESSMELPDAPTVFTKFVTSLAGPFDQITLNGPTVDWEAELVVVIGKQARHVPAARGWEYVAGLTVGQDLSDRTMQLAGPVPQFSLGKSLPGFGPTGPWLVTPDELRDRDDLALRCTVNGELVQDGRTTELIFPIADLVARLSAVLPLLPGDVIFTGTPAGIGAARNPQRFLAAGDELLTWAEGIGEMRHRFLDIGQQADVESVDDGVAAP